MSTLRFRPFRVGAFLALAFFLPGCPPTPAPAAPKPPAAPPVLIYGPARLAECTGHPEGYYTAAGFSGLLLIADTPAWPANLALLHNREPSLELLPELGLPYPADAASWQAWIGTALPAALASLKPLAPRRVVWKLECESAPSAAGYWDRKTDWKARGKQLRQAVAAALPGTASDAEAIFDYLAPGAPKGKPGPLGDFVSALQPGTLYAADPTPDWAGKPEKALKKIGQVFGCRRVLPQVWVSAKRVGSPAELAALGAALAGYRAGGGSCVVEQSCGDLFSLPAYRDALPALLPLLKAAGGR